MVAESRTWVDVEGAIRAWARETVSEVSERVFFAYNSQVNQPQIVLFRIAGPDDRALIQFDVWAKNKSVAATLAAALATHADRLSGYIFEPDEGPAVQLKGAAVQSSQWLPDGESANQRYVVQVIFTAFAAR